jgi:hypothetical protein
LAFSPHVSGGRTMDHQFRAVRKCSMGYRTMPLPQFFLQFTDAVSAIVRPAPGERLG